MTSLFYNPRVQQFDADGRPLAGARLWFYAAGTTEPQDVYADAGLSMVLPQPVVADSAGRFPAIYLGPAAYKVVLQDAQGVDIWPQDHVRPPATHSGNFLDGIATQAAAREAIGAASASEVTANTTSLAVINAQLNGIGGTLGQMAGHDDVSPSNLAAGFGSVLRQRLRFVNSDATPLSFFPVDGTIPQNTEGVEVFSEDIIPKKIGNTLLCRGIVSIARSSAGRMEVAVFWDGQASATDIYKLSNVGEASVPFSSQFTVGGLSAVNVMIRASSAGVLNLANSYGAASRSYLEIEEYEAA